MSLLIVLAEALISCFTILAAAAFFAGKGTDGKGMGAALGPAIFIGIPVFIYLIMLWPKQSTA
jgi:hypothetical protein